MATFKCITISLKTLEGFPKIYRRVGLGGVLAPPHTHTHTHTNLLWRCAGETLLGVETPSSAYVERSLGGEQGNHARVRGFDRGYWRV